MSEKHQTSLSGHSTLFPYNEPICSCLYLSHQKLTDVSKNLKKKTGNGRVLVVDGGGSLRCAILGGNPVVQAQNNGWAGIIVNGCIRDVDEINGCDIGVRALASHPIKASKKGLGEQRVPLNIAGTRICDGEWLYADTDGILVSQVELSV